MPSNVRRFLWLWCASFLIGAAEIPLTPPVSALEDFGVTPSAQMALAAAWSLLSLATLLPFLWLAVRRRRNWARWVLLVSFIISMPLVFLDPALFAADQLPLTAIEILSILVGAVAFYLLFTGDARSWFSEQSDIRAGDPVQ
jgi:K+ transporter